MIRHLLRWMRSFTLPRLVRRAIEILSAKVLLRHCRLGAGVGVGGRIRDEVEGTATVGNRVQFAGGIVPSLLRVKAGATLAIGDESHFNYGVTIEVSSQVRIGKRCMFGSFVRISDQEYGRTAPVTIGDEVWIAHGAIVEPGVTIGDGAVVSAGSVVTQDVPARGMAMGNPARVMSQGLASQKTA